MLVNAYCISIQYAYSRYCGERRRLGGGKGGRLTGRGSAELRERDGGHVERVAGDVAGVVSGWSRLIHLRGAEVSASKSLNYNSPQPLGGSE